ncbi:ATP-binding protein [Rhizobium leguminosarum]|uniref:ATP-binding protein n=1 Tax=Rhizobium leguminosarum TaxID=384 RepID=UPI001FDEE86A|nr:ATP-binding protein [Rhizobium leguminosarum]
MSDRYDFANLSPIEFESLCVDLVAAVTALRFERFSEGADDGIDGRHSRADGDIILQAKHYKNSSWTDLQKAAKAEKKNLLKLNPKTYFFVTSQPLTPGRKNIIVSILDHQSVTPSNIWGRTELNGYLADYPKVERKNIKLWLSSAAVLDRLLTSDIAVFTEATYDEIERILKVYVANPSLGKSAEILKATHCLLVSGPPGVGKTTLAQVLAAEYSDEGWDLVSITSIDDGFRAFRREGQQVFVFDDFLGKIRLDPASLARDENRIVRFMSMVHKDKAKRFILTTRSYILQAARVLSEAIDDTKVEVSEMVLDLSNYTRELKARILYNHLYHSEIDEAAILALLQGSTVREIVDHPNYMPRIIHWMTDEFRQRDVPPTEYPQAFLQTLNNPDKIWDKAFRHHISKNAQILLFCLYFAEQERFAQPGVKLDILRPFFERAIVEFRVIPKEDLRTSIFEDTLREVKSSFVLIDGTCAKFVNPSVQDYLSRETADPTVLSTLAQCVSTIQGVVALWKKIDTEASGQTRAVAARALLEAIIGGGVTGHLFLNDLAKAVGELIVAVGDFSYCERLRRESVSGLFWISEGRLPLLIDELDHGIYQHLPYAKAFGRYLRLEIYRFVAPDREEVMDLQDLADLASGLASARLEMSEQFYRNYEEAAEAAIDAISLGSIVDHDDQEQVIEDWLDEIEKIESLVPRSIGYWKKDELEDRISTLHRLRDERGRYQELQRARLGADAPDDRQAADRPFSNADMDSMFSSLQK